MTLKNSFLTSMKENLKRRNWVVAGSFLVFFFSFPIMIMLRIQNMIKRMEEYPKATFTLDKAYLSWISVNEVFAIVVGIVAIVCAIQGFSYLYSKKKVDLYESVPISRTKRFAVIYTNGILIYAIPYLINLLLSYLIIFAYGNLNGEVVKASILAFVVYLMFFLCIYHIAILAIMLTGNVIATVLAGSVFLFYEIAISYFRVLLQNTYFESYYYNYYQSNIESFCSPLYTFFDLANEVAKTGHGGLLVGKLFLLAILFGIPAYFAYHFRQAEASGKTMAYEKSKGIIKLLLMVPISLFGSYAFYDLSNESDLMSIIGLAVGLLLSHAIIEVIYEFDLRAAFSHKRHILYATIISGIIFAYFRLDFTGYDSYVPKLEKIKTASISLGSEYSYTIYDKEGTYIDVTKNALEKTDIKDITPILALAQKGQEIDSESENLTKMDAVVKYVLNSGRVVYRSFSVDITDEIAQKAMRAIYEADSYKNAVYQIFDSAFLDDFSGSKVKINDGISSVELKEDEVETFLEIYKKELKTLEFKERFEQLPLGEISIEYEKEEQSYDYSYRGTKILMWNYPIYASFTETIAFLEEKTGFKGYQLTPEMIEKIEVAYYRPTEAFDVTIGSSQMQLKEYEEKEEIAQIIPTLYPSNLMSYSVVNKWQSNFDIVIEFAQIKSSSKFEKEYYNYSFLKGKVPTFVKEDINFIEE